MILFFQKKGLKYDNLLEKGFFVSEKKKKKNKYITTIWVYRQNLDNKSLYGPHHEKNGFLHM